MISPASAVGLAGPHPALPGLPDHQDPPWPGPMCTPSPLLLALWLKPLLPAAAAEGAGRHGRPGGAVHSPPAAGWAGRGCAPWGGRTPRGDPGLRPLHRPPPAQLQKTLAQLLLQPQHPLREQVAPACGRATPGHLFPRSRAKEPSKVTYSDPSQLALAVPRLPGGRSGPSLPQRRRLGGSSPPLPSQDVDEGRGAGSPAHPTARAVPSVILLEGNGLCASCSWGGCGQ